MGSNYAPQRRESLALHHEDSREENALMVRLPTSIIGDAHRQRALSVPESVRALGEPLEPFYDACGGRQTISLSVRREDGQSSPGTFVFQQPFVLIGRCPESDLNLEDGGVSFRHIYLQMAGGRWLFVNLPAASGVPGEKGRSISGWFDPGSELTAGPYTIMHVAPEGVTSTALSTRVRETPALPSIELALINARSTSKKRSVLKISMSLTLIGSSRQCDVWLKDESVSRVHASLVLTPYGLWIVDLLGREGVRVDGRPAYWKQLHDGSVIQVGRFRFSVHFGAASSSSTVKVPEQPKDRKRRQSKAEAAPPAGSKSKGNDRKRGPSKAAAPAGSMSEGSVMKLVKHLTEMQAQFFEHSQLQTQLITEMLSHLGRSQQVSVRQDMARIDEIGRELNDIKTQLTRLPGDSSAGRDVGEGAGPSAQQSLEASAPVAAESLLSDAPVTRTETRTDPDNLQSSAHDRSQPAASSEQSLSAPTVKQPPLPLTGIPGRTTSPRGTSDAHAWLSQRMANLSQERNSRWRHILSVFNRKPASPPEE
jgi:pSer/pThr/pTyr-binding forkhead associated (FHA) protein